MGINTSDDLEAKTLSRVLIVDDDEMTRMLARDVLEADGFAVIEAGNGVEGLKKFQEFHPDIVLMDVEMPQMDGFTACQKIREYNAENIPIMLITGLEDVQSIEQAYTAGATDFATKPVNWIIMVQRIRYLLRASTLFRELKKSQAQLAGAQRMAKIGYWEWDIKVNRIQYSAEVAQIYGRTLTAKHTTIGDFIDFVHEDDRAHVMVELNRQHALNSTADFEFRAPVPDGSTRIVTVKGEVIHEHNGRPTLVAGTIQDITSFRQSEQKIHDLAYQDTLTGLPNRVSFRNALEAMITRSRQSGLQFAVALLDLDDFKRINDTLGHAAGDSLLQETAKRISAVVRERDAVAREFQINGKSGEAKSQNISRVGGDEFTLLLTGLRDAQNANKVVQRVLMSFDSPYQLSASSGISSHEVFVTASIGVAIYPVDGETVEELLKNADTAMFQAKRAGKNICRFYTAEMNVRSLERLSIESKLRRALERNELELHYQPQFDLRSGMPIGVEALLRWSNEELGNISPVEFIPLAEQTGLIIPIGEWVLKTACEQALRWQKAGLTDLIMSVNLSSVQFRQRHLDIALLDIVERSGLSPRLIELELTESIIMSHAEENIKVLQGIKDMGFRLAVDDFGTGYSSLAYLKRFPLDTLKIDRAFVRDIETDGNDRTISTAITSLGQNLGMKVVAEGVETQQQLALLRDFGCDIVQGFLFAKPMPEHKAFECLQTIIAAGGIGFDGKPLLQQ